MSDEVVSSGVFAPFATINHMFGKNCQTCGFGLYLVGVGGFEPPTSRTRTVRAFVQTSSLMVACWSYSCGLRLRDSCNLLLLFFRS